MFSRAAAAAAKSQPLPPPPLRPANIYPVASKCSSRLPSTLPALANLVLPLPVLSDTANHYTPCRGITGLASHTGHEGGSASGGVSASGLLRIPGRPNQALLKGAGTTTSSIPAASVRTYGSTSHTQRAVSTATSRLTSASTNCAQGAKNRQLLVVDPLDEPFALRGQRHDPGLGAGRRLNRRHFSSSSSSSTPSSNNPNMYTASFAFFEAIWEAGITHCFVNLGSDHPSIIEAMVKGQREKKDKFPRIITCPNEVGAAQFTST